MLLEGAGPVLAAGSSTSERMAVKDNIANRPPGMRLAGGLTLHRRSNLAGSSAHPAAVWQVATAGAYLPFFLRVAYRGKKNSATDAQTLLFYFEKTPASHRCAAGVIEYAPLQRSFSDLLLCSAFCPVRLPRCCHVVGCYRERHRCVV